jgi:hypothetical protein
MCGTMGAYTDVVTMPLNGRVRTIDRCIHQLIAALNAGGVETVACCCGHGDKVGNILLGDGRTILVLPPLKDGEIWSGSLHEKAELAAEGALNLKKKRAKKGGRK